MLIANECIEDRRLLGRNGVICKLDLKKAYNCVNLKFSRLYFAQSGFWGKMEKLDSFLY